MKRLLALCIICIFAVAITHAQDKQREEMMRDYERMMKKEPGNIEVHRSFISKWSSRTEDLIYVYENAISSSPGNVALQYALGYVYAITEKEELLDKAIQQFQKAAELDPNLLMAHFSLGAMYLKKGEYNLAEVELQKAIEMDGTLYTAYFNLTGLV